MSLGLQNKKSEKKVAAKDRKEGLGAKEGEAVPQLKTGGGHKGKSGEGKLLIKKQSPF